MGESVKGRVRVHSGRALSASLPSKKRGREDPMTSLEIVQTANESYR